MNENVFVDYLIQRITWTLVYTYLAIQATYTQIYKCYMNFFIDVFWSMIC